MDIFLPKNSYEVLDLFTIDVEEADEHLSRFVHIEALSEIRILRRDPDGTRSLMAYSILLTSDPDHSNRRDSDRISSHSKRLGDIGTRAESPRDTEGYIPTDSLLIEEFASAIDSVGCWDTDIVLHMGRSCTRCSSATVDRDEVRLTEYGNFEICLDMRSDDLDPDGLPS